MSTRKLILAALVTSWLCEAWVRGDLFSEAQLAYDRGAQTNGLTEAATLYQSAIKEGQVSGEVFFNLGNTLYRLDRPGAAILNYRRARHFLPRDADLKANERFVWQQTGALPVEPSPAARVLNEFSLFEWLMIAMLAFWGSALMLVLILLLRTPPDALRNMLYAGLVLLTLSVAGISHWLLQRAHPELVIIQPGVQALFAPLQGATPHFALPPGSVLSIEEQADGWVRVRQEKKKTGWIQDSQGAPVWPWTSKTSSLTDSQHP